jgi:hypothetical protein
MEVDNSNHFLFFVVAAIAISMLLCESPKISATSRQKVEAMNLRQRQDQRDRYPVVDADEVEPSDSVKRAKLKRQKQKYDKDAPFSRPGPKDAEIAFLPEWQFDFPALPVAKSDVIVIGKVLGAEAHRSENKLNVFSNFELKVDEVLKGDNLTVGSVINVQRIGGFVKYPDGRKVLFRLVGNGMPAVGERYLFFLTSADEDYDILTGYELSGDGVVLLDSSNQFQVYRRQNETDFLKSVRDAVSP